MADKETRNKRTGKPCSGCGGSGQISFFRGVSRFVMDWDDCPDCLGTGQEETTRESDEPPERPEKAKPNLNDDASDG